jgi:Cu/Ag efflux protein CusF
VRGVVQGLPPDHQTIAVEHEDIPGFMPSMTMPFTARDRNDIFRFKAWRRNFLSPQRH